MTEIQEELIGALIGLARSVDGRGEAVASRRNLRAVTAMVTDRMV